MADAMRALRRREIMMIDFLGFVRVVESSKVE
jgi:hypothetical protein